MVEVDNIKLAGLLTGYELDVIREGDVRVLLREDDDELTSFQMKSKMGY
jgi:N utilization substance protein A